MMRSGIAYDPVVHVPQPGLPPRVARGRANKGGRRSSQGHPKLTGVPHKSGNRMKQAAVIVIASIATVFVWGQEPETFMGLVVAPEERCSPYDRDDYSYPASIEADIIEGLGSVYGPYTGTCFADATETDIEHIVAVSEAHDSGLCAVDAEARKAFARDLLNLTLASPTLNRHQKSDNDLAEWTPTLNQCWYARRTIDVRLKYGLTIDSLEAMAVESVLSGCASTEMVFAECATPVDEISELEARLGEQAEITVGVAEAWRVQIAINDIMLRELLAYCQSRIVPICSHLEQVVEANAARVEKADELVARARRAVEGDDAVPTIP